MTNDSDPDGDNLVVVTTPVSGPSNGTLVLNADGTFTYTPNVNFTGTDTFTYQVADVDGGTSTATATLFVNPVNDSPVNLVPGNQTTPEDTPLIFSAGNGNALSVSDADSASITTTISFGHGTLTLGSVAGVTVTGDGTGSVSITGSPAAITAALNGLQYASAPDYNGADTLSVVSTDGVATTSANLALTVSPVADITADTIAATEDASISFNVLTGSNGATADTFEGSPAVTGYTQPANGTVTIDASGNVVYTPNANFNGVDTFAYTVTSGGVTETTTVTVNVAAVNDAPTQVLPPAQTGTEDTPVIFSGANGNQIVLGDIDAGASVTTTISVPAGSLLATATPGVTITGNGTGAVTLSGTPAAITAALNGLAYTPVADANGTVVMSVSTTDGVAAAVSGTVAIALSPVADIANDSTSTDEDTAAVISVLTNDSFENPGRAVTAVSNGANGSVVINGDGTVTYTPDANFHGTDTFTYTVTSGGVTESATVTVVVNPVNDPVTQVLPAAQSTAEDSALTFSSATTNTITVGDLDGDALTTTLSVTNGVLNLGTVAGVTVTGDGTGTITISGSAAAINAALDGLVYNPTADYNGAAVLSVTSTDGATTSSGTVAITVTAVTDIVADAITTAEDAAVTVNVLASDSFENAGAAVTAVTQPAHGTVTIGTGGNITYTPNANYNGSDSFTYTVTSGGVTETTTVSVSVAAVNDPLVTTVPAAQTTNEDTSRVFSSANGNAITVSEIDSDTITMTLSATNGLLTLGSIAGITASGNGTGTIIVTGSAAAITAALNGLAFAPNADFNGAAAITVTASDGTASTSNTIDVTVAPVADIVANATSTVEDTPVTINVLTNDNFEAATRTVTSVTQGTSGTVSFLADGTIVYTPDTNFNGTDTFTYTVTSAGTTETTTVTVSVGDVNDLPVTTGLADRSNLDGNSVSVNAASAFSDTDATDTLTYSATGLPAGLSIDSATGIISGTIDKNASQSGPYTVIVTASDGHPGGSVSASFTWSVANPGPTANNDTAALAEDTVANIAVLANDSDPDLDPLTVTSATAGNGTVTIKPDGTIDYTPSLNFNGTDTIVYQISDGNGGISTATVTVTVSPVNDAPTTSGLIALQDVDGQAVNINVSSAFSDLDGDTLTYAVTGLPPGLSFNPATGEITGTIDPSASLPSGDETYSITVTASDGNGGTVSAPFTWRILNIPPTSNDDAVTTPEDTPIVATVLANDYDPDGDPLVITHINGQAITLGGPAILTANGEVTLNTDAFGNQVLVYTPNANYNGTDSLVYTTNDGNSGTDTATLTITIVPQNDAPTVDALANLTNDDSDAVSIDVSPYFHDIDTPDGDTMTYSAIGLPAGLSINSATGVISGTIDPSASQSGPYTVVVTGTDSAGAAVSESFTWTVNNPKPTGVADSETVSENGSITVLAASGVLTNDSDPDLDPLTVGAVNGSPAGVGAPVAGSAGGLFTVNADGSYTFDSNSDFEDLQSGETRTTTITYTVSDGNGGFSTADVTITVTGNNDAPVATSLADVTTVDNAPLTVNAAAAFSDIDGDTLSYTATGLPTGLSINPATGEITGTIDKSASQGGTGGVYSVVVTADDGHGGLTPVTLTITITNPLPTAMDDVNAVVEDTPVSGNVLTNDIDPDGDVRTVTEFDIPGAGGPFAPGDTATIAGVGTFTLDSLGAYTFTPVQDYNGPVPVVTYTMSDADGATDTATLTLGPVTPVNDAPVSTAIAGQSSNDSNVIILNTAPNFTDVDGDTLSYAATGLPPGLSIDTSTGEITGTLDHLASAAGSYSVTVLAMDPDGEITQQTFTWTVTNPAPTGAAIANTAGIDNTAVSLATGAGFADPDGDTLTFSATGLPAGLSINPATGEITGTLSKNASVGGPSSNGVYTIAVTATDSQGALVTRTFTYTVSNPVPVAGDDSFTGDEDTDIIGDVTGDDSDADGDALTYALTTSPSHGTIVFNADGTFTYTPTGNYNGPDSFTYTVTDANGATATATVSLTVTPVNDAPVAADVSETTNEDTPLNGTLVATDVDGDTLTFTKATDPTHGTVTVNTDGTYTYTPDANYFGPDSFTYTVSDGNGGTVTKTVSIDVTSVNDVPVAVNDAATGNEDTDITGDVTPGTAGQDSDIDGDPLTVALVTGPTHGTLVLNADGSFTYTPDADYNGPDSFTYRVNDGTANSNIATVSLTVTPVNDPPVAADVSTTTAEDTPLNGTLVATDVDGDTLTFTKATDPTHGTVTVNTDGTYTYTPDANYFGPDSFTYTVSDGNGGTVTKTVSIDVTSVNDVPVAVNDAATGNEDTDITGDVTPGTIGQGHRHRRQSADGCAGHRPDQHGTLVLNADGSFTYTPDADYNGPDSFTYRVNDGTADSAIATVSLTVTPVNDPPVAADVSTTTAEDTPLNGTLVATDVDGDTLTFTKATDPTHGTVTVNTDGTYTYTPDANYFGPDSFTYTVSDGNGGMVTKTVSIDVTSVNDVPVANNDAYTLNEDTILNLPAPGVLANDCDIDGDPLTVALVTGPTHGTLTLNADGSFTYTPDADYNGADSFTYRVNDGSRPTATSDGQPDDHAGQRCSGRSTTTAYTTPEDTPLIGTLAGQRPTSTATR